jgi:hypothetical protein
MALLQRALTLLWGEAEALPAALLARYPELRRARVRRGGLPPRIGGWFLGYSSVAGIALGRTIWLGRKVPPSADLLLHELCHVHQFEAIPAFPIRYAWESLRRGYHHNRFEVDARQFALERTRDHPRSPMSEGV